LWWQRPNVHARQGVRIHGTIQLLALQCQPW
jgi:hypothetical protein